PDSDGYFGQEFIAHTFGIQAPGDVAGSFFRHGAAGAEDAVSDDRLSLSLAAGRQRRARLPSDVLNQEVRGVDALRCNQSADKADDEKHPNFHEFHSLMETNQDDSPRSIVPIQVASLQLL